MAYIVVISGFIHMKQNWNKEFNVFSFSTCKLQSNYFLIKVSKNGDSIHKHGWCWSVERTFSQKINTAGLGTDSPNKQWSDSTFVDFLFGDIFQKTASLPLTFIGTCPQSEIITSNSRAWTQPIEEAPNSKRTLCQIFSLDRISHFQEILPVVSVLKNLLTLSSRGRMWEMD